MNAVVVVIQENRPSRQSRLAAILVAIAVNIGEFLSADSAKLEIAKIQARHGDGAGCCRTNLRVGGGVNPAGLQDFADTIRTGGGKHQGIIARTIGDGARFAIEDAVIVVVQENRPARRPGIADIFDAIAIEVDIFLATDQNCGGDITGKFGRATGGIGGRGRDDLTQRDGCRESSIDDGIAGDVGDDIDEAQERLTFSVTRWIAGGVGVDFNAIGTAGNAGESSLNVDIPRADQSGRQVGKVLQTVGAGVDVARVVGSWAATKECDAEAGIGVYGISKDRVPVVAGVDFHAAAVIEGDHVAFPGDRATDGVIAGASVDVHACRTVPERADTIGSDTDQIALQNVTGRGGVIEDDPVSEGASRNDIADASATDCVVSGAGDNETFAAGERGGTGDVRSQ